MADGQMSLDSAHPGDFLEYLAAQGIHAAPDDYLPSQVFGDYDIARDRPPLAQDRTPVDRLYYLGPWLRARD